MFSFHTTGPNKFLGYDRDKIKEGFGESENIVTILKSFILEPVSLFISIRPVIHLGFQKYGYRRSHSLRSQIR